MPKIVIANEGAAPPSEGAGKSVLFTKNDGLYVVLESGTVVGPLAGPLSMAGGALTGTYPNPGLANNAVTTTKIANGAVTGAKLDPTLIDPVAGTAGLRTLGTGAQQAAAGNDPRLSDSRAPSGAASGDLAGSYPAPTVALGAITNAKLASAVSGVLPTTNEKGALAGTSAPNASNKYAVVVGSPSASDVLTWNGSAWAPAAAPTPSDVLWEWNGTDVTQFDTITPVVSSGQNASLARSPYDLTTNKAFSTLNLTALFTGGGGAVAFRVTDPAFPGLPEQFRLRVGVSAVPFGIRIGVMFFDPSTWGAGLTGGGMTYGDTFLRWVIAKGAAALPSPLPAFPPFDLPGVTPGWADPSTVDNFNGMLNEWDCTLRPGAGGNPPAVALYGRSLGYVGGSNAYSITVDRGQLIGTGSIGGAVDPSFNNKSLTGLAIIAQSTATGTFTASLNNLQILQY